MRKKQSLNIQGYRPPQVNHKQTTLRKEGKFYEHKASVQKRRNTQLFVSAVIATIWFIIVCVSLADAMKPTATQDEWAQLGQEIGASLGLVLQLPFLIVAFMGTVFNWLAWIFIKKGFAMTCGILYCVSVLLSFFNALGYIPCIVLSFIGYANLKSKK